MGASISVNLPNNALKNYQYKEPASSGVRRKVSMGGKVSLQSCDVTNQL